MKKTLYTTLAVAGLGIGAAQAALVSGDFSGGITNTTQAWFDLDDGVLGNGRYSHDQTFDVNVSGSAEVLAEQAEGSMVTQVFNNSQTGLSTFSFDFTPAAGHSIEYTVVGWNGTDLTASADKRVFYINPTFSNNGPTIQNGAVSLVTGDVTADTTSATFDITGYNQIGVAFWQDNQTGSGVGSQLDNVVIAPVVVPEPSSTALLGLAGFGLILRRRR